MRSFLVGLFSVTALFAVSEGELTFSVAGDNYVSHGAQGVLQTLKNQKRIVVAVKDRDAKFLFALTVDVPQESETQTLHLNTHDSVMSVVFRSTKGSMAIMPVVQFAKEDPNAIEIERIEKETNEYESESPADAKLRKRRHNDPHPPRKKLHVEYRRVKPRWHSMTKEERLR
ncbi:MAG TPA: hypothetical protein PLY93_13400, partial [Turneriella sp.]|nr:hypothetical protein [Turneriella sp.]